MLYYSHLSHFGSKGLILRGIELADVLLSRTDINAAHYMSVQMSKVRFLRFQANERKQTRNEGSQNKAEFSSQFERIHPKARIRSLGSADSFTKEQSVSERLAATNSEGSREKDVENVSEASPFRVHVETEKDSQALLYQAEALIEKGKLDQA